MVGVPRHPSFSSNLVPRDVRVRPTPSPQDASPQPEGGGAAAQGRAGGRAPGSRGREGGGGLPAPPPAALRAATGPPSPGAGNFWRRRAAPAAPTPTGRSAGVQLGFPILRLPAPGARPSRRRRRPLTILQMEAMFRTVISLKVTAIPHRHLYKGKTGPAMVERSRGGRARRRRRRGGGLGSGFQFGWEKGGREGGEEAGRAGKAGGGRESGGAGSGGAREPGPRPAAPGGGAARAPRAARTPRALRPRPGPGPRGSSSRLRLPPWLGFSLFSFSASCFTPNRLESAARPGLAQLQPVPRADPSAPAASSAQLRPAAPPGKLGPSPRWVSAGGRCSARAGDSGPLSLFTCSFRPRGPQQPRVFTFGRVEEARGRGDYVQLFVCPRVSS